LYSSYPKISSFLFCFIATHCFPSALFHLRLPFIPSFYQSFSSLDIPYIHPTFSLYDFSSLVSHEKKKKWLRTFSVYQQVMIRAWPHFEKGLEKNRPLRTNGSDWQVYERWTVVHCGYSKAPILIALHVLKVGKLWCTQFFFYPIVIHSFFSGYFFLLTPHNFQHL